MCKAMRDGWFGSPLPSPPYTHTKPVGNVRPLPCFDAHAGAGSLEISPGLEKSFCLSGNSNNKADSTLCPVSLQASSNETTALPGSKENQALSHGSVQSCLYIHSD